MTEVLRDTLSINKAKRMTRRAAHEATTTPDPNTINPRTWNMYKEAVEFKVTAISPFLHHVHQLENATMDFIDGLLPLLRAPLPRVWETVEGGLAEPLRATVSHKHPHIAGGDMNETAVRASLQDFETHLQLQVRKPVSQWTDALETVRGRFPELEHARSQFERRLKKVGNVERKAEKEQRKATGVTRGRTTMKRRGPRTGLSGMFYRCTHPRADERIEAEGATGPGWVEGVEGVENPEVDDATVSREFKKEERDMKMKDRQRKLTVARESFAGIEQQLYEQLSGLCRDAAWTKSYVAASLLMAKELFQESVFNLGDTMQPLPAVKTSALPGVTSSRPGTASVRGQPPAGEEGMEETFSVTELVPGRLGSNMAANAALPEFATHGRSRATLEELQMQASRRMQATKASAQPLELHASPTARPGERVVPARRGLTDRPLEAVPRELLRAPTDSVPVKAGGGMAPAVAAPLTPGKTVGAQAAYA